MLASGDQLEDVDQARHGLMWYFFHELGIPELGNVRKNGGSELYHKLLDLLEAESSDLGSGSFVCGDVWALANCFGKYPEH
ncbi:hypothetical protein HG531_002136 [Fusarium graminearum]|nr:hypothetical protein HG531_002136 [Fusarium graminearum]